MRILRWARRLPWLVAFLAYFLWELALANLRVALEVLTPGYSMTPGIVRVPTRTRSDWEMMLLANAISMTPGTLSLEVSEDGADLFVHTLYVRSREEFLDHMATMERVLLRALR